MHNSEMKLGRAAVQIGSIAVLLIVMSSGAVFSQEDSRGDDGILEAVIRYAQSRGEAFDCVVVSQRTVDNYVDLGQTLLHKLKRKNILLVAGSDPKCNAGARVLWVGPIDRSGSRRARVPAGDFLPSISGRPAFVLRKNWFGRWRVVDVLSAE